jgi:cellulose synthase/poly-beta-1,6-N-acetylglucosamine synthase-like glycosyltransferase
VGALRELISYFAEPTVGAVTGAKVIKTDEGGLSESEGLYWKYESFIKEKETHLGTCTGVAGEILAVWRDLYEPPPDHIINDDFYIAMRIIQRGYRVIYAPKARSVEGVSASAQDEMVRRARIVAGRYQAIALARDLLPWNKPLVVWQVVSHKFLRPLVPLAMLGAWLGNLLALAWPSTATGVLGALTLAAPFNVWLLGAQALFYALALIGARVGKRGLLGKVLYLPTFLVNSNWAAVVGLYRFLAKRQTTLWQKARRS